MRDVLHHTRTVFFTFALGIVLSFHAAGGVDDEESTRDKPPEIGGLILQLGAEAFSEREDAFAKIRSHGLAVMAQLELAADSVDPEIKLRVGRLLGLIVADAPVETAVLWALANRKPMDDVLRRVREEADLARQPVVLAREGEIEFRFYGQYPHGEKTNTEYIVSNTNKAYESLLVLEGKELDRLARLREAWQQRVGREGKVPVLRVRLVWMEKKSPRVADLRDIVGEQVKQFIHQLHWSDDGLLSFNVATNPRHEPAKRVDAEIHLIMAME